MTVPRGLTLGRKISNFCRLDTPYAISIFAVPFLSFFALKRSAYSIQSATISFELAMKAAFAYASSFSFIFSIIINTTIDKIRQNWFCYVKIKIGDWEC